MKFTEVIIMFTKDSPTRLAHSLPPLRDVNLPIILLDDSVESDDSQTDKKICVEYPNVYFHGKHEQRQFLQSLNALKFPINNFVKALGDSSWTLPFNRNYAIILAVCNGFNSVFFMDDDIVVRDTSIFHDFVVKLKQVDFVGAHIGGMPDNSVIGHLMTLIGMKTPGNLSGGFLAFNIKSAKEYFLDVYNEDWIWLTLHRPEARITKLSEVYQLIYNPFEKAQAKAIAQEWGELVLDGVVEVIETHSDRYLLEDIKFWANVLSKRKIQLIDLVEQLTCMNFLSGAKVARAVLNSLPLIQPSALSNLFKTYHRLRPKWQSLIQHIMSATSMNLSVSQVCLHETIY